MILIGNALSIPLKDHSVHCCITSPPYWGLRDYGSADQLGLEPTPEEYVANMVSAFREVWRVLRPDGTLWLNLGDSYASSHTSHQGKSGQMSNRSVAGKRDKVRHWGVPDGIAPKSLIGIPWRVAFALQADGWILRSDIIWAKPNPMPESVTDRPTKSHEYLFMFAKAQRYYFDQDAVRENHSRDWQGQSGPGVRGASSGKSWRPGPRDPNFRHGSSQWEKQSDAQMNPMGRNIRDVWTIATQPFPGAHFAVMPPKLVEPCIKAGCPEGGTVLDPFAGAGTVGLVADRLRRQFVGVDLSPAFAQMARDRIVDDCPLFNRTGES